MALIFIVAGSIGLIATIVAFNSNAYRNLSRRYAEKKDEHEPAEELKPD